MESPSETSQSQAKEQTNVSKASVPDKVMFDVIKEYESHPCLWQKSHRDYKNNFRKADAIADIATLTDLTPELVKEKLRMLRTVYFQNAQAVKKSKSGSGGGRQPKWKFFSALSFLSSEVAEAGSVDNMDSNSSVISSSIMTRF